MSSNLRKRIEDWRIDDVVWIAVVIWTVALLGSAAVVAAGYGAGLVLGL